MRAFKYVTVMIVTMFFLVAGCDLASPLSDDSASLNKGQTLNQFSQHQNPTFAPVDSTLYMTADGDTTGMGND